MMTFLLNQLQLQLTPTGVETVSVETPYVVDVDICSEVITSTEIETVSVEILFTVDVDVCSEDIDTDSR
jgi:hypothetical protein